MTTEQKPKKKKPIIAIIIESIIVSITTSTLFFMAVPNHFFRRDRSIARAKACFSNLRVLQGAIEMFNMDETPKITECNEVTLNLLVEKKYLKRDFLNYYPEIQCRYISNGDLSENGTVYCEYHGSIDGFFKGEFDYNRRVAESNRDTLKLFIIVVTVCLGPGLLYFIINII